MWVALGGWQSLRDRIGGSHRARGGVGRTGGHHGDGDVDESLVDESIVDCGIDIDIDFDPGYSVDPRHSV
jgi:hypothetical protein